MTIHIIGRVTESGALECELPSGVPTGKARITIEIPVENQWTQEELDAALRVDPLSGEEIVKAGLLGGWAEEGIADSVEWVAQQRRKRHDRRLQR